MRNKIVLTGGHAATTAVAVVEQIRLMNYNWKIYWLGVKNAIEGKKIVTLESEVLPRLGVTFVPLTTGRLQRKFTIWTIPSLIKLPIGFIQSFYYLLKIKPKLVLSFGGFASFPVVLSAWFLKIPVIIHEQTSAAGRANLVGSKYAREITLSRKESKKYFSKNIVKVIGNPVMTEISKIKNTSPTASSTIFITGGSRGSRSINMVVEKILKRLLSKYKVIHQTGGLDYHKFSDIKQSLPQALRDNYQVFVRVNPLEMWKIYLEASLIVSRAGANTVSEIMLTKTPAILIPLPISYMDEQTKNAKIAQNWGVAKIIFQKNLTPERLYKEIENIMNKRQFLINSLRNKISPDAGAAKKLVKIIEKYMK